MNGETIRQSVTIVNPQGLHVRPATSFAQTATRFQSEVIVTRPGFPPVSGKSAINLLTLGAEQGAELIIEINGADAQEALQAVLEVLAKVEEP